MTAGKFARLQFLARVIGKECRHLETTDQRLFAAAMTPARRAANAMLGEVVARGWGE